MGYKATNKRPLGSFMIVNGKRMPYIPGAIAEAAKDRAEKGNREPIKHFCLRGDRTIR